MEVAARRYVYFLQAGNGSPIKIGSAVNIDARLQKLQIGHPDRLKLVGAFVDNDGTHERLLHRVFSLIRLRGEWFTPSDPLTLLIDDRSREILHSVGNITIEQGAWEPWYSNTPPYHRVRGTTKELTSPDRVLWLYGDEPRGYWQGRHWAMGRVYAQTHDRHPPQNEDESAWRRWLFVPLSDPHKPTEAEIDRLLDIRLPQVPLFLKRKFMYESPLMLLGPQ